MLSFLNILKVVMKEYDKAVCCGFVLIRSMLIFLYSANCTKVNINAWGKNSHFSFYYIKQQYCIRRQYATKKNYLLVFHFPSYLVFIFLESMSLYFSRACTFIYIILDVLILQRVFFNRRAFRES